MNWLLIFLGGGIGSVVRYGCSVLSLRFYAGNFPLATFISNVVACTALVLFAHVIQDKSQTAEWVKPLLIVGFCGGFSTFSTFSNETVQLMTSGNYILAAINILLSLATGIGIIYWLRP
jgi:CrcB protein